MKKVFLPCCLLLFSLLFSCQSSTDSISPEDSKVSEKWRLVKIIATGLTPGYEIPLPYKETYEFNSDGTFRRYRSNGYKATGTYRDTLLSGNELYLVVTFDNPELGYHDLGWFKHPKAEVYLRKNEANELVESYIASDGPAFYYQKIEDRKQ